MNTEIETFALDRDGKKKLSFKGTEIAIVSSRYDGGQEATRWTVLKLYRTTGGKFVLQVIGHTIWQGESNRYTATVCDDEQGVIETLTREGYLSNLAKELLEAAGIECVEEIE